MIAVEHDPVSLAATVGVTIVDVIVDRLLWLPPAAPAIAALALIGWRFRPIAGARTDTPHRERRDSSNRRLRRSTPSSLPNPPSVLTTPSFPVRSPSSTSASSYRRLGRRPRRVGPDDAARWCDAIARGLRSGASLSVAIDQSERPPSINRELRSGLAASGHLVDGTGRAATGIASKLAALVPNDGVSPDLRLVVSVLSTVGRLGGPAAEPIDRTAVILRARAAAQAERAAQSAQARLSALVMTLLPVAMLMVLVTTSASVRTAVADPIGLGVVSVGVALNLVGWTWMHRIIERDNG